MDISVKFLGGAQTVTGSRYLFEFDQSYKLLVDCGLFQGLKPLRLRNWDHFPVDPHTIDALVLTHAHLDHSGYIPKLVKEGFRGPIYCTEATCQLLEILWRDSAKLLEEEAHYASKKGFSKHNPPLPLYTSSDVDKALFLLKPTFFDESIDVNNSISIIFRNAGHILGASIVEMTVKGDQQTKKIVLSGDLGRTYHPILNAPEKIKQADVLLVESTYGNRVMEDEVEKSLANEINTAFEHNGCVLIPAFAVGRTQTLIYYLLKLIKEKAIPVVPIYIDSPMAINSTRIYHNGEHFYKSDFDESIFTSKHIHYCTSQDQSAALNNIKSKAIIISASGMCTGGRILHHMYHRLQNENDTILFVGYQAEGTRGEKIINGAKTIRIFGQEVPIKCKVGQIGTLSAHADRNELTDWLKHFESSPKFTFIVHGEKRSSEAFAHHIEKELGWKPIVPFYMESFQLFSNI